MPQESPSNSNKKPKQRFGGRRRNYVDSFRWGFVPEEESDNGTVKQTASRPAVSKSDTKQSNMEKGDRSMISEVSSSDSAPKRQRSRPSKIAAKTDTAKPVNTPKAKTESGNTTKQSPKVSAPQTAPGKRPSKGRKRSKAVLPQYVGNNNYEEDEDLKLPSYGRTPIPTDDELPVPQKIVKKTAVKPAIKKPAPVSAPRVAESVVPVASSAAFQPKRTQMVWDPDKAEYVPLVVTPKPEPRRSAVQKPEPQKTESKKPEKRRERTDQRTKKTAAIEKAVSPRETRPVSPKKTSPSNQGANAPRSQPDVPVPRSLSSAPARRSNVPKFVESPIPDPMDVEAEVSGFAELGVSEAMLEALKIVRYLEPTPIQAGVFQKVQAGVDLMGQAQTGTGKTAAFSMPIIEGVELCPPGNDPVALILVPTRELAVQVRDEAMRLAYGRDIRITACYGGKPLAKQIERLKSGIDILVGTPGRILDLMNRRALSLGALRWVVLDEADRMLDIGFRPDIEKILRQTPQERQTLLFSATLPQPVVRLAEKYMKSPEVLDFSNKSVAVDTIDQFYVTVDPERKFDALVYLLEEQQPRQAIIFTRTKRGADRLARLLSNRFEKLAAIHGDLAQSERDRVMTQVRSGSLRYLVATDVVGRGIDVSGISHIINYDVPKFCDDYVHRVGRTGRMGREGVAFTFVTVQEGSELTRIEMRIDKLLKRAELKGFESFTKPHDPNATLEDELPPEPAKPVFGKPIRKVRRAL